MLKQEVYMNKNDLFLLGGYDLEMLEIKTLLESFNLEYKDKQLTWGAKLSDYREYLNFEGTIYGIELDEDIAPPHNYVAIDHHGENSHKQSSLEQVAVLLKLKLSRKQQLIAANDSKYISGMRELCATPEEIKHTRAADRKAQGVTPEDETLAQKSIKEAKVQDCIFSYTPHFSAIADKIYDKYTSYIIYNETKVIFYGYNLQELIEFLDHYQIDNSMIYFGGGDYGFLGIKENILDDKKIENLIKEFQQMQEDKEPFYSYHTFLFPFTFTNNFKPNEKWQYEPFSIQTPKDYNEFVYFYKHVQDALFNSENKNEKFISQYYNYKNDKGTYTIESKLGNFALEVDGISLRIFTTGVAILAFNLKNTKYYQPKDILAINDFGRRIYPQFLGLEDFTVATKKAILAQKITLHLQGEEVIIEDFDKFDSIKTIDSTNLLPDFIKTLIEKNFDTIRPIIDDRMFVISQYNNDALINQLKTQTDCGSYLYETDDFWYQYLFIDGDDKTCQSKHMSKKLIAETTYDRWIEAGTLFGVSRYSFVALTGSWFGKERLLPHMQTMYFQMFSLLLAYRASIIKFADEIQDTTKQKDDVITNKTKELYKNYLNFLNQLYFKEITAQDQGIELYAQAIKVMNIEKYMGDLDDEINELHNYVDFIEEQKRTKSMDRIALLGSALLLPALITSFFGMNIIDFDSIKGQYNILVYAGLGLSFISVPIILLAWKIIKEKLRNKGES